MLTPIDPLVKDAISLASVLVESIPGLTPATVAIALKDPRNYPSLTAFQMGQVLKAGNVFPQTTSEQLLAALQEASYTKSESKSATKQLFPSSQYRSLGPFGAHTNGFDDTEAAKALSQPLTKIKVHHGDIIDGFQAFYGQDQKEFPFHGGSGGSSVDLLLHGNALIEVSGFHGQWFGTHAILQLTFHIRNDSGKITTTTYGTMKYATSTTPFTLQAQENERIIAFLGSVASGNNGQSRYLASIGVTVQTN